MTEVAKTAYDMISGMTPELRSGAFVFVTTSDEALVATHLATGISVFREDEGISMILPVDVAAMAGQNIDHPMRCITLNVFSSLEGVGLTAAVSAALGENGIPCNMVAAFHHDHVFVPESMSGRAMEILTRLQESA